MFKGTVKRDFGSPFFHYLNLPGPLTNGLKYIRFCLRFCGVIKMLGLKKLLVGVWYPQESCFGRCFIDSPGYDTLGRLTRLGIKPQGKWKIRITRPILNQNSKYFNPLAISPGRFALWKNWRRKSRWTVPLNMIRFFYWLDTHSAKKCVR